MTTNIAPCPAMLALHMRYVLERGTTTQEAIAKRIRQGVSPYSLEYANATGFDFGMFYDASRFEKSEKSTPLFNEKAIPKTLYLLQILNGGSWGHDLESNPATLKGVIMYIAGQVDDGKTTFPGGAAVAALGTFMRSTYTIKASRADYRNEGTQGSSSLRALCAVGALSKNVHSNVFTIKNPGMIAFLRDAINGVALSERAPFPAPDYAPIVHPGNMPADCRERALAIMGCAAPDDAPASPAPVKATRKRGSAGKNK